MNGTTPKTPSTTKVGARNSQPTDCDRILAPLIVRERPGARLRELCAAAAVKPGRLRAAPAPGLFPVTEVLHLLLGGRGHLIQGVGRRQLAGDCLVEERRRRLEHLPMKGERRRAAEELTLVLHHRVIAADL